MAQLSKVPLTVWLDEKVKGWRDLSPDDLDTKVNALWEEGEFVRLVVSVWSNDTEQVKIGDTTYQYIVLVGEENSLAEWDRIIRKSANT